MSICRTKPAAEGNVPQAETDWAALDAMTDQEIEAAALADPANPPWSDLQLAGAKRVAFVKHLRLKLHLGRSSFASRFHIDEALITAWERHESEPEARAMAYLHVIAADPDGVSKTLEAASAQVAE